MGLQTQPLNSKFTHWEMFGNNFSQNQATDDKITKIIKDWSSLPQDKHKVSPTIFLCVCAHMTLMYAS
jgi:hypothetical protein